MNQMIYRKPLSQTNSSRNNLITVAHLSNSLILTQVLHTALIINHRPLMSFRSIVNQIILTAFQSCLKKISYYA